MGQRMLVHEQGLGSTLLYCIISLSNSLGSEEEKQLFEDLIPSINCYENHRAGLSASLGARMKPHLLQM